MSFKPDSSSTSRNSARALSRKTLLDTIDEICAHQHRSDFELPISQDSPFLSELFNRHLPKIPKKQQRLIAARVFKLFLTTNSDRLKITELKKAHFQKYIDYRLTEISAQTKRSISPQTVNKELYAISSALTSAPLYFQELEDYQKLKIPKAKEKDSSRSLNLGNSEFAILLEYLRKPKTGKQTAMVELHRKRLADDLEFRFETGLRRKEVAKLKIVQFVRSENILKNDKRCKTDTTKIFPLSKRAQEIIEKRIKEGELEFIFTKEGEPTPSEYRSLKNACAELNIPYGRYTDNGFIPHDLRRAFATNIIAGTDIETARELLGHSNIAMTGNYLQTNKARLFAAVRNLDNIDVEFELESIFEQVKNGKVDKKKLCRKNTENR
jgi:integrase